MVHSHTVHLPLGALLTTCTMCGTGIYPPLCAHKDHEHCKDGNCGAERRGSASKYCNTDRAWADKFGWGTYGGSGQIAQCGLFDVASSAAHVALTPTPCTLH